MKRTVAVILAAAALAAYSSPLFPFYSKVLPTSLHFENSISAFAGADFLSYNILLTGTKSDFGKSLSAGVSYFDYGGIITAEERDSSENPYFTDPEIIYDTLKAGKASFFASYAGRAGSVMLTGLVNFSYSYFSDARVFESSADAGVCYDGFIDLSLNLMDILPVVYYSSDAGFSYRPYGLLSISKEVFESQSVRIIPSLNIYGYSGSYSDQQLLHGKYAFSRALGIRADFKRVSFYGEFFSERLLFNAEYSLNDRAKALFSYTGGSYASSVKFGFQFTL